MMYKSRRILTAAFLSLPPRLPSQLVTGSTAPLTSSSNFCNAGAEAFVTNLIGYPKQKRAGLTVRPFALLYPQNETFINTRGLSSLSSSSLSASFSSSSSFTESKASEPNISISDTYDGGNIEFIGRGTEGDVATIWLRVKADPYTQLEKKNYSQYFSFRSTISDITVPTTVKYVIENAGKTSYARAWSDFTTFFSTNLHDPYSWRRKLDTLYNGATGHLSWTHTHSAGGESVYFSYFPPFSNERHLNLMSRCGASSSCTVTSLGQSLEGREMECITLGKGERKCWIIHRQHPGEPMAEYYAEGLLSRLLGLDTGGSIDGMASRALELYTFYIVPNMCPDGSVRGHLRTNGIGTNLNREWCPTGMKGDSNYYEAPTLQRSPEVYCVLNKMDETGVDVFLDVHGDEEIPYNFVAGAEGCPNWGPRLQNLQGAFLAAYSRANSDMQREIAYEPEDPGTCRMNVCSNQIAYRFDCLAVTLEQPFKDCWSNPDPERGWNPARARMLGGSVLDALVYIHPYLRAKGEFWKEFPKEDAYIRPTPKYRDRLNN